MQVFETIEEDEFAIFPRLVRERIACKDCGESTSLGTEIEIVASSYTILSAITS